VRVGTRRPLADSRGQDAEAARIYKHPDAVTYQGDRTGDSRATPGNRCRDWTARNRPRFMGSLHRHRVPPVRKTQKTRLRQTFIIAFGQGGEDSPPR
jgi:hypothetical protein